MKIKLLSLAALLVAALGLSGCYDVYPGAYGYRGGPGPVYAGGYYPGGWGDWGGWGYPVYQGHDYWHHDWDWDHDRWEHGGWGHDHFVVPERRGFVAHNFGAPMGGHGFAVAHNDGFYGGRFRGGSGAGGWRGGGGYHGRSSGSHGGHR